ncbi:small subunit ribosomal protein S20 [Cerasibacillus quisquiliarum]|uniref:Small ribosomal subunit protein bS20 n=1 Tax=Cerasibacillus quisquiliarum TaxID=227865 RepID=A0A511UWN9_9BACI|nr:30S ribosomal protein S20 [Cerasibacillus quisquiliarum]MBB5145559.1 small subunit ribosomal protein S20 [Cerasibacillus quisquiliarum]GEN31045.1 30S ribosomal protein S20 [Cerasibacillus quisquiliarum]
MANIKSAIKRTRTNNRKRLQNQKERTTMRSHIKAVEVAIELNDKAKAQEAYQSAVKVIDRAVQKGIIHANNGNRQKARLARKMKLR